MSRILVAVDESDASRRVATFVNRFFAGLDIEMLAISVARSASTWIPPATPFGSVYAWPYAVDLDQAEALRDEAVDDAEQVLGRAGVNEDESIVDVGDPAAVILDTARRRDVDLVVVGSNHKNLLERLISRSISGEVLRESDRPVLLVP